MTQRWVPWLAGLTVLGAALRFAFLDAKGFWEDEAVTLLLVRMDFGEMLSSLPDFERTPPLYYALAWAWAKLFGEGEVGMRSLSALLGTATIPVAFLAARELVTPRTALVAAALVAVNPILVWYSQEARSYALLVLLAALSLLYFARSLDHPRRANLAGWAVVSALAVSTHYFAGFLVAAEAAWLLRSLGPRRELLGAIALPLLVAIALAPLALDQADRDGEWITDASLAARVVQVPAFLLVGFELRMPLAALAAAAAAGLFAAGLWFAWSRGDERERHGALLAAGIASAGFLAPVLLALGGADYLVYKNLVWVVVPSLVAAAAGFAAARAGLAGAAAGGALAALSLGIVLATATEPKYQRESWREAAEAMGEAEGPRATVFTPGLAGFEPLTAAYLPGAVEAERSATVSEIDLLALPRRPSGAIENAELPDVADAPPAPAPGFALAETRRDGRFLLFRYTASSPRTIEVSALEEAALDPGTRAAVIVEPGP